MKMGLFALLAMLSASFAQADVLKLEAGANTIENVVISKAGVATVKGRSSALTTVGAGVRAKKVAFIPVKVYVAQLLVSEAAKYVRTEAGALDSMDAMSTVALQLTFLRGVDADTVQSSFDDALNANKVETSNPAIKAFLDAVSAGGDAEDQKNLTIVGEKLAAGIEVITYENTKGQSVSIQGGAGFVKNILSIWLGVPADGGIENLKKALIGA